MERKDKFEFDNAECVDLMMGLGEVMAYCKRCREEAMREDPKLCKFWDDEIARYKKLFDRIAKGE
jgi:hypothetical protein